MVPTATGVLEVEVLARRDFQTGALGGRRHQIDCQMAGMGVPALRHRQRGAAADAGCWVMVMGVFDGQLLHTSVSRGPGALSATSLLK